MRRIEAERLERVRSLSAHLQQNALMFRGELPFQPPQLNVKGVVPLAVLAAALLLLSMSGKARNSMLLKTALVLSGRALQNAILAERAQA